MVAGDGVVTTVRLDTPPNNLLDLRIVGALAAALDELAEDGRTRVVLLTAAGRHFCTGMNLQAKRTGDGSGLDRGDAPARLYEHALRIVANPLPIVAAVQGGAIGGGLGLTLLADFRVATPATTFAANFARLGIHHGFGLTVTLPALVGQQRAMELLYTGRRVRGAEAREVGLCDRLVSDEELVPTATELADEIAGSAPLAVRAIRRTLRGDLAQRFRSSVELELAEQRRLSATEDAREGVRAALDRREPRFTGR